MTASSNVETQDAGLQSRNALDWDFLKELGSYERHFNGIEAEYRKLASVWLLAGFAGIGFILKENPSMGVPGEVAIMGIGFATSIGIFLLWIVDLLVYHRLLDACFVEAMRIEASHPELPQVRIKMVHSQIGGEVTTRLRWFYILLTIAPIAFSAPIFMLWCIKQEMWSAAFITADATALYLGVTIRMIWINSLSLRKAAGSAPASAIR